MYFDIVSEQVGPALGMFDVFGWTGPPILGGVHYFIVPLITVLTKEPEMLQPECVLQAYNAGKCWGLAQLHGSGSLYCSPDLLASFNGAMKSCGREEKRGKERKERGRKERGGEVDYDAQLERGHWLAKTGPVDKR